MRIKTGHFFVLILAASLGFLGFAGIQSRLVYADIPHHVEWASMDISNSGHFISEFSASWLVPSLPVGCYPGEQNVLWIGLQYQTFVSGGVIQPVLDGRACQHGILGSGSWQIYVNWYDDRCGNCDFSTPYLVNPGDQITASISLVMDGRGCCTYNASITDTTLGLVSTKVFENLPSSTNPVVDLESFNVPYCSDFPASGVTAFTSIGLKDEMSNPLTPSWQTHKDNYFGVCAGGVQISPAGNVILYYGDITLPTLSCPTSANPTSGTVEVAVQFSAYCSGGVPPYTYEWQFNDGTGQHSDMQTPPPYTYWYNLGYPGTQVFYPSLAVTDASGTVLHPGVHNIAVSCVRYCSM